MKFFRYILVFLGVFALIYSFTSHYYVNAYDNTAFLMTIEDKFGEDSMLTIERSTPVDTTVYIDWGDGTIDTILLDTPSKDIAHAYPSRTNYLISITLADENIGIATIAYNNTSLIREINSFGDIGLQSISKLTKTHNDIEVFPTTIPSTLTDLSYMFYFNSYNGDISSWDTSNVVNMSYMFGKYGGGVGSNQDISNWDTSSVTNMSHMFYNNTALQNISNWDTSSVTDMSYMFAVTSIENGSNPDIRNWDTSSVTNMSSMFNYNRYFNQDISNWDTSSVTDMRYMFTYARAFNKNINNWDTSNVTNINAMFAYTNFNRDITAWDTSNVTDMGALFQGNNAFSFDIASSWDFSNVTNMSYMFYDVEQINIDLSNLDTSNVVNMSSMFGSRYGNSEVNPDISDWNTSNVNNMASMFYNNMGFNQDLSGWDTSNVTDMSNMFNNADDFNGDISQWDTSSVTNMSGMFANKKEMINDLSQWNTSNVTDMSQMFYMSNPLGDITQWDTSSVTNMNQMFYRSVRFNQDISEWDFSNVTSMNEFLAQDIYQITSLSNTNLEKIITKIMSYNGAIYHPSGSRIIFDYMVTPEFQQMINDFNESKMSGAQIQTRGTGYLITFLDFDGDVIYDRVASSSSNQFKYIITPALPEIEHIEYYYENSGEWIIEDTGDEVDIDISTGNIIFDSDKNITVIPMYTPVNYTVTLSHSIGGYENPSQGNTYRYTYLTYQNQLPVLINEGYEFNGWLRNQNDSSDLAIMQLQLSDVNQLTRLYASWSIETYNITYHLDGHITTGTYTVDDYSIDIPDSRDGYTFGWYLTDDFQGYPKSNLYGTTGNIDLYGKWIPNTYTITFDDRGNTTTNSYNTDTTDLTFDEPQRIGYRFLGWYDENDEIQTFTPGQIGDFTLYAKWEAIIYTITFNTNGGTALQPITYTYNEAILINNNPIREGYQFNGWKDLPYSMPDHDLTLTAAWIKLDSDPQGLGVNTDDLISSQTYYNSDFLFDFELLSLESKTLENIFENDLNNLTVSEYNVVSGYNLVLTLSVNGGSASELIFLNSPLKIKIMFKGFDPETSMLVSSQAGAYEELSYTINEDGSISLELTELTNVIMLQQDTGQGFSFWWIIVILMILGSVSYGGYYYYYVYKKERENSEEVLHVT